MPVFCALDDVKRRREPSLGDLKFVTLCRQAWLCRPWPATAHLPASILAEPLRTMEAAWGEDEVLAKLAVNSLIGLWAIDECYSHKLRSSSYESDAPKVR